MPTHYQGRHRKTHHMGSRPAASLIAAAALSLGVIASDASAVGTATASSEGVAPPAQPHLPAPTADATLDAARVRPVMSTTAMGSIGGAGIVSVGAAAASAMSATASAPAKAGTPPAAAAKPAAAKPVNKAPERSVGARRGSLGTMAGSPGGGTVPVGLAAARSLDLSMPVTGTRITSRYGPRWGRLHAGMDFAGPVGTPLRSVGLGVVTFAGPQGAYGNKVEVTLYDGTEVHYGHMHRINVKVGNQVTSGDRLGTLGNTGRSTGPHLHLEVRPGGGAPINPEPWLKERGLL